MPGLFQPVGLLVAKSRHAVLTLATVLALVLVLVLVPLPPVALGAAVSTRLDWGSKAPMPTSRFALGLAAAPNGKLYAVGGSTIAGVSDAVEEYDSATNTWTARASLPAPRSEPGVAAMSNGKLYVAGGSQVAGPNPTVFEYDPGTNIWSTKAPLHTSRFGLGLAAAANGKLYAVGGSTGAASATVEEYDPATDAWTTRAPMATARQYLGLAVAANGKLYAVGGVNSSAVLDSVEEYDPATNVWMTRTSMGGPRYQLGVAAAPNGKLYAIGGANGPTVVTVEEYDPATDVWTLKTSMLAPRFRLGVATAPNGRLYAIGGSTKVGAGGLATVDEYDPDANTWAVPLLLQSIPTPATRFDVAAAVANGRIYIFGGRTSLGGAPIDSVSEYTPATNAWRNVANMPTARYAAAAATAPNGKIYVAGGRGAGAAALTTVEELTPPSGGVGSGTWRGAEPGGVAQLPSGRFLSGMALAANGNLYLVGGTNRSAQLWAVKEYTPGGATWPQLADMQTARSGLALALGGDNRLYAVGGDDQQADADEPIKPSQHVEAYTPPTSPGGNGSWSTEAALAQLPAPRFAPGLIGAPNGNLFALGGWDGAHPTATVFEYDRAANGWSTQNGLPSRASLPTPRYGFGTALVGNQLFIIGGYITAPTDLVEVGTFTELPSVSVGGPYTVVSGGSVQLNGSGVDPEGSALSYAWDLDGDLLYETAGQNPTFSAVGLPAGVRTVRVRAMDAQGAYGLASTTVTVTGASRLAFAAQPGPALAGALLSTQPVVRAEDANGTLVPGFTGPITLTFGANPGSGTLGGTTIVNAVNGVATFSNLSVNAAGAGYTLVASSGGLTTATSAPFTITAPPPLLAPTSCAPRPNVRVTTAVAGTGQLTAALTAQTSAGTTVNSLSSVRITAITNAAVQINGSPVTIGPTVILPAGTQQATLLLDRQAPAQNPGQASTVAFIVSDICGEWPSFVGGGPSAF